MPKVRVYFSNIDFLWQLLNVSGLVVDMSKTKKISNKEVQSKCGWTPFHEMSVDVSPYGTIINGKKVVWDQKLIDKGFGKPFSFN